MTEMKIFKHLRHALIVTGYYEIARKLGV